MLFSQGFYYTITFSKIHIFAQADNFVLGVLPVSSRKKMFFVFWISGNRRRVPFCSSPTLSGRTYLFFLWFITSACARFCDKLLLSFLETRLKLSSLLTFESSSFRCSISYSKYRRVFSVNNLWLLHVLFFGIRVFSH